MSKLAKRLRASGDNEASSHIDMLEHAIKEIANKRKLDAVAAAAMRAIALTALEMCDDG